MKKLLILFIPLIFFFGCEEENTNCDCDCLDPLACNYGEVEADCEYPGDFGCFGTTDSVGIVNLGWMQLPDPDDPWNDAGIWVSYINYVDTVFASYAGVWDPDCLCACEEITEISNNHYNNSNWLNKDCSEFVEGTLFNEGGAIYIDD